MGFIIIGCFCHLNLVDDGKLHKAINANDKMHIIEEMVLFPQPEPVQHIELDPQRVNHNCVICNVTSANHTQLLSIVANL